MLARGHRYLAPPEETKISLEVARRRAALATLLSQEPEVFQRLPLWSLLRNRFDALLEVLEAGGCFILRRGTIEDCYANPSPPGAFGKREAADEEAASLIGADEADVRQRYADALRAIENAAPGSLVDEHAFLRECLGAVLGATFQRLRAGTKTDQLHQVAAAAHSSGAEIFTLENASSPEPDGRCALRVGLASTLFTVSGLPAVIDREENLSAAVERLLPSPKR